MIPATPDYAAVAERDVGLLRGERREHIMGMRTEIHRFLRRIVEQGIDEGCFEATLDPGVVTNSLLELLHGTVRWFRPGGRRSYADVAEFYVALLARRPRSAPGRKQHRPVSADGGRHAALPRRSGRRSPIASPMPPHSRHGSPARQLAGVRTARRRVSPAALHAHGIGRGDAFAAYLYNCPEYSRCSSAA